MKRLVLALSLCVPTFAGAEPVDNVLVVESTHPNLSAKIQRKITVSAEMLAKFETSRLDCAIRIPGVMDYQLLSLARNRITQRGTVFVADASMSAEDVSEDPARSVQVSVGLKDIATRVSMHRKAISITSSSLMPTEFVVSNVLEMPIVSIGEWEATARGVINCTFYPLQN